jgi:hypothetical protein
LTYIVTDYDGAETTNTVVYDVVIKNPCIDQAHVTITAPTLSAEDYVVASGDQTWTYLPGTFTVNTVPIAHDLCGDFVFTPTYEGTPLADLTNPILSFSETPKEFTVNTDDENLVGTVKAYGVNVEFATYPSADWSSVATATATEDITFSNPCIQDFNFAAATSTNPAPDAYTGSNISTDVTEFPITPSFCVVNYSCTSVVRVDL